MIHNSSGSLQLALVQKVNGVTSAIPVASSPDGGSPYVNSIQLATSFTAGTEWKVRLQTELDKSGMITFRAKAWSPSLPAGTPYRLQSLNWDVVGAVPSSGALPLSKSALMSSNSSATNYRGTVSFKDYRIQSLGMTVSAWIKPATQTFLGNSQDPICGSEYTPGRNATKEGYVHWIGKQSTRTSTEWLLRQYPVGAVDDCTSPRQLSPPGCPAWPLQPTANCCTTGCYGYNGPGTDRRNSISAYSFAGGGATGTGAGVRYDPFAAVDAGGSNDVGAFFDNKWHHVVAVYDPGDLFDYTAGVRLYIDGRLINDIRTSTYSSPGVANYANATYQVDMYNTLAPLYVGAVNQAPGVWTQFQGDVDELSIFKYRLSVEDISAMFAYRSP